MTATEVALAIAIVGLAGVVLDLGIRLANIRDDLNRAREDATAYRLLLEESEAAHLAALHSGALGRHLDVSASCLTVLADKAKRPETRSAARVYLQAVCAARAWAVKRGKPE